MECRQVRQRDRRNAGPDGRRTFSLYPGEPTRTSYGEDLYMRIFTYQRPATVPAPEGQASPAPGRVKGS